MKNTNNMNFLWHIEEIKTTAEDKKIRNTVFERWQNIIWIEEKNKIWMLAVIDIIQKNPHYQKMKKIDKINTITTTLQELNAHPDRFLFWLSGNHPNQYHKIMLLKEISLN